MQDQIEQRVNTSFQLSSTTQKVSLLAESFSTSEFSGSPLVQFPGTFYERTTGQNEVMSHNITRVEADGSCQIDVSHLSFCQKRAPQINSPQATILNDCEWQPNVSKISSVKVNLVETSFLQRGTFQVDSSPASTNTIGSIQAGSYQTSILEFNAVKKGILQDNSVQTNSTQVNITQSNVSEGFLTRSISIEQFLSRHASDSQNTRIPNWTGLFHGQIPLNLNIDITDLPSGQLAEASITGFDSSGRPNAGTLTLDFNGNGLGWFVDSTPWENSEFAQSLTDSASRATTGSDAFGRYDLLTTLLHELGHLAGIIQGNPAYDQHLQTIANTKLFVGDGFTAALTPDGSHLDSRVHPYALMNSTLAPGVRKLPSTIDLQILNAVRNGITSTGTIALPTAPLQSAPLVGILNGSFDQSDAWHTRGDARILTNQAVLRENSRQLSNFTQTFVIPDGATALQFTIVDADLDASTLAPGDAFEAALLDARSLRSLIAPSNGLTQTDAFLNLQHTGQTYLGSNVTVFEGNAPNTRIVRVDLKDIAPQTLATLSFDLLGFGSKDGSVTIDDVMLIVGNQSAPITAPDTVTTTQATPVVINVLSNDRDLDGTIDAATLQLNSAPQNGTALINADGTVTYTPNRSFVGTDRFTYRVKDNAGLSSPETTVIVTTSNLAPQIVEIVKDSTMTEGAIANFTATATDPGDDSLLYTWNFGDGTAPIDGVEISLLWDLNPFRFLNFQNLAQLKF